MEYLLPPTYRLIMETTSEAGSTRPKCNNQWTAAELLLDYIGLAPMEKFALINLDVKTYPISITTIYIGQGSQIMIKIADIFRSALIANAQQIIVGHNHPSGDPTPSPEDLTVTRALIDAGKMLDVPVLDHIIVSGLTGHTYSMREQRQGGF